MHSTIISVSDQANVTFEGCLIQEITSSIIDVFSLSFNATETEFNTLETEDVTIVPFYFGQDGFQITFQNSFLTNLVDDADYPFQAWFQIDQSQSVLLDQFYVDAESKCANNDYGLLSQYYS